MSKQIHHFTVDAFATIDPKENTLFLQDLAEDVEDAIINVIEGHGLAGLVNYEIRTKKVK